jgi:hypothetical protein
MHAMTDTQLQPSPFGSAAALRARQEQWDRFHAWEAAHPREFPDLATAWQWYEEMYDLARKTGAISPRTHLDEAKVRRIQLSQARLARMPWSS